MSCDNLNSTYFSMIFQKSGIFGPFFSSPHKIINARAFQNGRILQFLKPWFQIWSQKLEISHNNKEHIGVCFSLKTFFSNINHWSGASSESSVRLNLAYRVCISGRKPQDQGLLHGHHQLERIPGPSGEPSDHGRTRQQRWHERRTVGVGYHGGELRQVLKFKGQK